MWKRKQDENSKDLSKTETSNHKGGELNVGLNAAPSGTLSSVLSSDASDSAVEAYYNESLIKLDKNMKPKPFIASWKDIDPGKKIKFTIKKALNGKMVMSLKLMTGFIL